MLKLIIFHNVSMKKACICYFFIDFQAFFIVLEYANAKAGMHLLNKKHNSQAFLVPYYFYPAICMFINVIFYLSESHAFSIEHYCN